MSAVEANEFDGRESAQSAVASQEHASHAAGAEAIQKQILADNEVVTSPAANLDGLHVGEFARSIQGGEEGAGIRCVAFLWFDRGGIFSKKHAEAK